MNCGGLDFVQEVSLESDARSGDGDCLIILPRLVADDRLLINDDVLESSSSHASKLLL